MSYNGFLKSIILSTVLMILAFLEPSYANQNNLNCGIATDSKNNHPDTQNKSRIYALDPVSNTLGWLSVSVTEAALEQEAREIFAKQPRYYKGEPYDTPLWLMSKDEMLKWNTPLTQYVLSELLKIPRINEEFLKASDDKINVLVVVEKIKQGDTSGSIDSIWHADFSKKRGIVKPVQQVILNLYEFESYPTEFLLSSNQEALFKKLDEISISELAPPLISTWPGLQTYKLQSGQIMMTSGDVYHRRTIATRTAWRYFLRIDFLQ